MIKNRILTKDMFSNAKKIKNNRIFLTEKKEEIHEYQNLDNNKKRIIKMKIAEEEKNLENSLLKLSNRFDNITSLKINKENKDFSEKYNKFSKKHLKTIDSLMQNLSDIYNNKGYQINLKNNLFKLNPLLETKTNKIYLSCLVTSNNNTNNKHKSINANNTSKAVEYMKKLENIISKDNTEEKLRNKACNISQNKVIKNRLKIKQKRKEEKQNKILTDSIKSLIGLMNDNMNRIENQDFIRKRNKSYVVKRREKEIFSNEKNNTGISNIQKDINILTERKKNLININNSPIIKRNNEKKSTFSNYYINTKNSKLYDLSNTYNYKTFNSSKKLNKEQLNELILFDSNNKKNNKENDTLLAKNENKNYILNTPKIFKNIDLNKEKSKSLTKAFSLTNDDSSLSYRSRIDNSKTKHSSLLKFKENGLNSFNISNKYNYNNTSDRKSKYPSSRKLKTEEKNKKVPSEFKILTPKKLFNDDEIDKDKFIKRMYKSFISGDYKDAKKYIKIYLSKIKKLSEKETDDIMNKYITQNYNLNVKKLQNLINEKEISKKIFKLYLNNNDYSRIEPLFKLLTDKDEKILQFDKKIAKISNS